MQELKSLKKNRNSNAGVSNEQPKPPNMMEIDISSAASALLSIGTPMRKSFITQHPSSVVSVDWMKVSDASPTSIAPAN